MDVDLANDVIIKERHVDVYPKDRYPTENDKPRLGQKLNKGAMVTLTGGVKPKKGVSADDYEETLRKRIVDNGGEHLMYNVEEFTWTFKVPHFQ